MKYVFYCLLVLASVSRCYADANQDELVKKLRRLVDPHVSRGDVSEETATNKWGLVVRNLQLSICLKDGLQETTTNGPVLLMVRVKNVSTNEWFSVDHYNNEPQDGFDFQITNPSGKETTLLAGVPHGSGGSSCIGPNQIGRFEINLSRLFTFDDLGTYKILASRRTISPPTEKPLTLISNPLFLAITADPK